MDLTQITPSLLDGISQKLGVDAKESKIALVANEDQIDPQAFPASLSTISRLGVAWQNLEIQRKDNNLLMHPRTKSQQSIANGPMT